MVVLSSKQVLLFVLLFAATINTLFRFPLDKVVMVLVILLTYAEHERVNKKAVASSLLFGFAIVVAYIVNLFSFSLLLLFPIVGILFVSAVATNSDNFHALYYALWMHIVFGLFFTIHSYFVGPESYTRFVHLLYDKGLPFLHAPMGFTPTVQTFGTLTLAWLLLFYHKREYIGLERADKWMLVLAFLTTLMTFNRNTLVLFIFVNMIYNRRIFYLFLTVFIAGFVYFFDFISKLILNLDTINSRKLGLEGFELSYLKSESIWIYLFGRGNNLVADQFVNQTQLGSGYNYIENGLAVMLHSVGVVGFLIYGTVVGAFIYSLVKQRKWFLAFFAVYFFFVAQLFTNEFFSSTFYVMIVVLVLLSRANRPQINNTFADCNV